MAWPIRGVPAWRLAALILAIASSFGGFQCRQPGKGSFGPLAQRDVPKANYEDSVSAFFLEPLNQINLDSILSVLPQTAWRRLRCSSSGAFSKY